MALQLPGRALEAQVEQLFLGLGQLGVQFLFGGDAQLRGKAVSHQPSPNSRLTTSAVSASRASGACSLTSALTELTLDHPALHRELMDRAAQRLPGHRLGYAGKLEPDPAGLHVRDPPLRRSLARTHAGLGRLLRQRPVRVDVDPDLPATADVPRHGDTGGLDLPVGHVRVLQSLDSELTERHVGSAGSVAGPVRTVLLPVLNPARNEHASALLPRGRGLGYPATPLRLTRALGPLLGSGPQGGLLRLSPGPAGRRLALIDPDLHADPAEGGTGLVEAVVDVRAQRVQRHPALTVELRPRHLRAAETARALDPDPLGAALHRALDRLAHGPPEGNPAGQLFGNALGGQLLEVAADAVSLGASAADDDARPGGVDVHPHPVPGPLDLDLGDASPLHAALQHPPDRHVLGHVFLVQLVGVPAALEVRGDAQPEPVRVHLLSH